MNSTPPSSSISAHLSVQVWDHDGSLQQAQAAVQRSDWALATQCLYQSVLQLEVEPRVAGTDGASFSFVDHALKTIQLLALQVLEFGDFQDRWDVAKVFSALGARLTQLEGWPQAVPRGNGTTPLDGLISPLLDYLRDDDYDPEIHWFVTRILSEFRQSDVLTALIDLLQASDKADLQEMAITVLAGFGAAAVPALTTLLGSDQTRLAAVTALAQIREPASVEPLMQVVHDDNPAIRAAAIAALGSTRDRRIPGLLIEAVHDPEATVRQVAVTDLGFRADLLADVDVVNLVQPLLKDPNPAVCQQTAIALSRLGTSTAAVALAETAQSVQTPLALQIECIRALGWMNTLDGLTALHHVLGHLVSGWATDEISADIAPVIVLELISALGRTKAPQLKHQATVYLIAFLQTCLPGWQTPAMRQAIALELGNLGDSNALEPLLHLAVDPELSVQLHAIAALKHLNSTQAHHHLTAWVTDESKSAAIRQAAAIALEEWGDGHQRIGR